MNRSDRKKKSNRIYSTLGLLALLGITSFYLVQMNQSVSIDSNISQHSGNWAYDYSAGLQHRYHLEFDGGGETLGDNERSASSVVLHSDLFITSHGFSKGAYSVEYRLGNVSHAEIWSNEKELLGGSLKAMEEFSRGSIFLALDGNGKVLERYTSQEMNPILSQVFELIVAELEIVVENRETWEQEQGGILGFGPLAYRSKNVSQGAIEITRTRKNYDSLYALADYEAGMDSEIETQTSIELAPRGYVRRFKGNERVVVGAGDGSKQPSLYDMEWNLSLQYVNSQKGVNTLAEELSEGETLRKQGDQRNVQETARRKSLLARAGGLTPAKFRQGLLSSGTLGDMPNHNRWLWQSIALLKLFPELCLEFPGFLDKSAFNDEGKVLLVDLLTTVGHQEAQQALREMLQHPKMQDSETYYDFVQRGVFLKDMDSTTIELFQDLQSENQPRAIQVAASIALGGAAKSLEASGNHELALELGKEIVGRLSAAEDSTERSGYIAAMANAQLDEFVPQLLGETHHDEALVRSSAVHALSYSDSPEVRERLRNLFTDEEAAVRAQSLKVFSEKAIDADDVYNLVELVEDRRLNAGEFYRLLKIASRLKADGDEVAGDLVAAIRARRPKQASVRKLLAQLR